MQNGFYWLIDAEGKLSIGEFSDVIKNGEVWQLVGDEQSFTTKEITDSYTILPDPIPEPKIPRKEGYYKVIIHSKLSSGKSNDKKIIAEWGGKYWSLFGADNDFKDDSYFSWINVKPIEL